MSTITPVRRRSLPPVPRPARPARPVRTEEPGQAFVARLRASAPGFAVAAGAEGAVVREAVPPARHRRSRCRLVLRDADGGERDLTFLGQAGQPTAAGGARFDGFIRRWLAAGQPRAEAWLVPDGDASDGVAIDLSAWVATS